MKQEDQFEEIENDKQIQGLTGKIRERIPQGMRSMWDPSLKSWITWNQMLLLEDKNQYVPATLRFELFENIKLIYNSNVDSLLKFKKELFFCKLHSMFFYFFGIIPNPFFF